MSYKTTDTQLNTAFSEYGEVSSARVVMDRDTGRPKGFGFVEMPDAAQAQAAIKALNGTDMDGRSLTVNEARPREENSRRSSGNGGSKRW